MTPRDPDWEGRARESFARQGFMGLLGAEMTEIAPGACAVALALRPDLRQQHGYGHAGAAWAIADTAMGYAAQSLMGPGDGVVSVEVKMNLLAPARGARLIARARVEKAGRTLTVCRADVAAVDGEGRETAVALAIGTFMALQGVPEPGA